MKNKWLLLLFTFTLFNQIVSQNLFDELVSTTESNKTSIFSTDETKLLKKNRIKLTNPYLIPDDKKDLFFIKSKPEPIQTLHNKYIISGYNKDLTQVLVYNQKIPINYNGSIYYELDIKKAGLYHIPITFFTKDNKYFTIFRTVQKLAVPGLLNIEAKHKKAFIDFYNSELGELSKDNLENNITRAELAYFLCMLTNIKINHEKNEHHWAHSYIQEVVKNGWMGLFIDDKFYPNKSISRFEYIQALLSIEKKELTSTGQHWLNRFIMTAKNEKIIFNTNVNNIFKPITWTEFAIETCRYPGIIKTYNQKKLEKKKDDEILNLETKKEIVNIIKQNKYNIENPELYINNLVDYVITNEEKYILEGQVFPIADVQLNNSKINITNEGYFREVIPLIKGKNTINLSTKNKISSFNIFLIYTPENIQEHWVHDTYAKLVYLDIIEDNATFNPRLDVTRKDLAHILFNLISTNNRNEVINNVTSRNSDLLNYSVEIASMLDKNIMSLDSNNDFNPEQTLTRAEALSAVIRATNLPIKNISSTLHYWDITKNHWASKYIMTAIENNIISTKQNYFYPDRIINHGELIALISKTPQTRELMNKVFK